MDARRFHDGNVQQLQPDEVFVFGSNLAGRHGKGAALTAAKKFGASRGLYEGYAGQSYAIPTKDENLRSLPYSAIHGRVRRFLSFAARNPSKTFYLTAVGTGLAGKSPELMKAMFADAPMNVIFPPEFK
jgi:hypothetical protein